MVDAKAGVAAPQGGIDITLPLTVPRTDIPTSGPLTVKATGAMPVLTFSRPGTAKITVGDLTLHLTPKDASGNLTVLGKFDAPCKLNAGQNAVLTSFGITGTSRTTGPATTASSTSGSTAPSTPAGATSGGTTTDATMVGPTAASVSTGATSGLGTVGVMLLAVGTLVAATAAFLFGSWLHRRRAGNCD